MKKTENKSGKSGMQVMKKLMAFIGNYKIFLGLSIVLAAVTVIYSFIFRSCSAMRSMRSLQPTRSISRRCGSI